MLNLKSLLKVDYILIKVLIILVCVNNIQLLRYPIKSSIQNDQPISQIPKKPSYIIFASKYLRPGHPYKISATILQNTHNKVKLFFYIYKDYELIASTNRELSVDIPQDMSIILPSNLIPGNYNLKIETNWVNDVFSKNTVLGEQKLTLIEKFLTILILIEKPIYKQNELIRFKVISISSDLTFNQEPIDVHLKDSNGNILKKWLSRKMDQNFLNFEYELGDQLTFGQWTIEAIVQQFSEINSFFVKEFYPNEFEVFVSMANSFLTTDPFVSGLIMANYSNGIPVCGNVTLYATIQSSRLNSKSEKAPAIEQKLKLPNGYTHFRIDMTELKNLIEENAFDNSIVTIKAYVSENELEITNSGFASAQILKRKYNLKFLGSEIQTFRKGMPFEVFCILTENNDQQVNYETLLNKFLSITPIIYYEDHEQILYTRSFMMMDSSNAGIWKIEFNIFNELDQNDINYIKKIVLNASFLNEDYQSLDLTWTSNTLFYENNFIKHSKVLNEEHKKNTIFSQLTLFPFETISKRYIKIWSSTSEPKVGSNIIFHIRSNFYVKMVNYILITKNIILNTGRIVMDSLIKTFHILVDKQMSPATSILVYYVDETGEIISDLLYFPVDIFLKSNNSENDKSSIDYNELSMFENYFLNNKNHKNVFDQVIDEKLNDNTIKVSNAYLANGEIINNEFKLNLFGKNEEQIILASLQSFLREIAPQSQLSKINIELNLLRYEKQDFNQKNLQVFFNEDGLEEKIIKFPTSNNGLNSNKIFENTGLLVFTDEKKTYCNSIDCQNETKIDDFMTQCKKNEENYYCKMVLENETTKPIKTRFKKNFVSNHFKQNWLWQDLTFDLKGQKVLNFNVLDLTNPSWFLTAFSLTKDGLNLVNKDIELYIIKPIQLKLKHPSQCILGEHISVQVNVVNHLSNPIELLINIELNEKFNLLSLNHNNLQNDQNSFSYNSYRNIHENVFFVNAEQTSTINFAIEPKKIGILRIRVTARTSATTETATAEINVKENVYQSFYIENFVLDLTSNQNFIKYLQLNTLNEKLGSSLIFQNLEFILFNNCFNHLLPIETLSLTENFKEKMKNKNFSLKKKNSKSSFTRLADENVYQFSKNIYTILYINEFNLKNSINTTLLFNQLYLNLQSILSFQNSDGGFRRYKMQNSKSNVKLTAFILKIFSLANTLNHPYGPNVKLIEQNIINKAVLFIINHQNNLGVFKENDESKKINYSSTLSNDNYYLTIEVELTSNVLIALNNIETDSKEILSKLEFVKKKSIKYLDSMLEITNGLEDSYTLSILAYCLNLIKTKKANQALIYLNSRIKKIEDQYYWSKKIDYIRFEDSNDINDFSKIEKNGLIDQSRNFKATAYGLMTQVLCKSFIQKEIVKWLNSNMQIQGNFIPFYDLVLATESIFKYSIENKKLDKTFFNVEAENYGQKTRLKLNIDDSLLDYSFSPTKNNKENWIIKASGNSLGVLQARVNYAINWDSFLNSHQQSDNKESETFFDLRVNYFLLGPNFSGLKFEICLKSHLKEKNRPVLLKFRLPTSFHVSQNHLYSMVQNDMINNLKEATYMNDDTIILIFEKLDNYELCFPLFLQRMYIAANINPYILFEIIDLDLPKISSQKLIILQEINKINICDVCGSYQCINCPVNNISSSSSIIKFDYFICTLSFLLLIIV